jgi:predicted ABC-type ATPase
MSGLWGVAPTLRQKRIFMINTKNTLPHLYIIAGCNGAGKTTASYTILPEIPESVAMEAGRIMLLRIDQLMKEGVSFAFETTLSARSYVSLIKIAKEKDYEVTLLYFWLSSPRVAKERVAKRVSKGGHNIPSSTIERRYYAGVRNLMNLYIPICDNWMVINSLGESPELVANGAIDGKKVVINSDIWEIISRQSEGGKKQ